ncbi:MAG: NAD(+)/NADH kinase [Candidatus Micrarchaeia archaeon]
MEGEETGMIESFFVYKEKGINTKHLEAAFEKNGIKKKTNADLVIAIGGDGTLLRACSKFFKKPVLPIKAGSDFGLLFKHSISEANMLAEKVANSNYKLINEPLLKAHVGNMSFLSVGDFYFQRGRENGAVRYNIRIRYDKKAIGIKAVGDGFIISTPLGSTGYFSYLERLYGKPARPIRGIGFEHILPHYLEETVNGKKSKPRLRRMLSKDFLLEARPTRDLDQCLYSSSFVNYCVRIRKNQRMLFELSDEHANIMEI